MDRFSAPRPLPGRRFSAPRVPCRGDITSVSFARVPPVSTVQRYRLRNPASGREIVLAAEPGEIYVDRDSGTPMEVVGKLLPLAPSASKLPWAVENLRFCPWCNQLAQKDLNDCPTCGRRMGPLGA
jgi:hypothetical protein